MTCDGDCSPTARFGMLRSIDVLCILSTSQEKPSQLWYEQRLT
eukprot:CAMPEP_0184333922 /NCGR_PEP_ID=MMETSP1089-20130417/2866_1 /TAXON_ID=38269 ORGANISM="Gloeochaete wittrockiana, Strain SAG46.84" /NCGR_SAMPLE_ID=MMETSP1089 /ASSEMBLY_ACC=CAM_ASM_000445 /LENGTH=42 /DNA_ID= /DNA_START= /DNA_END= /DNA_ORIENTATION=